MSETEFIQVKDLEEHDRIAAGAVLGSVKTLEDLTVKNIVSADQNKYAVTLFRLGTIFVFEETLVRVYVRDA